MSKDLQCVQGARSMTKANLHGANQGVDGRKIPGNHGYKSISRRYTVKIFSKNTSRKVYKVVRITIEIGAKNWTVWTGGMCWARVMARYRDKVMAVAFAIQSFTRNFTVWTGVGYKLGPKRNRNKNHLSETHEYGNFSPNNDKQSILRIKLPKLKSEAMATCSFNMQAAGYCSELNN